MTSVIYSQFDFAGALLHTPVHTDGMRKTTFHAHTWKLCYACCTRIPSALVHPLAGEHPQVNHGFLQLMDGVHMFGWTVQEHIQRKGHALEHLCEQHM